MPDETANPPNRCLVFSLNGEKFAVEVLNITEIIDYRRLTKLPKSPRWISGVVDLRGEALPVVDLRQLLGLPPLETVVNASIMILEIDLDGDPTKLGAIVDSVHTVVDMPPNPASTPAEVQSNSDARFVKRITRNENGFLMVLDIDGVFSQSNLTEFQET